MIIDVVSVQEEYSELTLDHLLIDISCHLISPCFSFARSSLLIHLGSPPGVSTLVPRPPRLSIKMTKLIHWLLVLCVKMLGKGPQGIIFQKDNPIF